jgi:hypothetical protein
MRDVLTHDPFVITAVAACGTAPILLLTLPAEDSRTGGQAPHFDDDECGQAVLALLLAAIVFFGITRCGTWRLSRCASAS